MARTVAIVVPVPDLMNALRTKCFLVWSATLTRKGVSVDDLSREPLPHRLIGVRRTKIEAERLAARHGQPL